MGTPFQASHGVQWLVDQIPPKPMSRKSGETPEYPLGSARGFGGQAVGHSPASKLAWATGPQTGRLGLREAGVWGYVGRG